MKRFSAIALALVLALSALCLAGCGDTPAKEETVLTGEELFIGTWEMEYDFSHLITDAFKDYSDLFKDLKYVQPFTVTFSKDNAISQKIDWDKAEDMLKELKTTYAEGYEKFVAALLESAGSDLTPDDYFAAKETTLEAEADAFVEKIRSSLESAEGEGYYYINGDKYTVLSEEGEFKEDDCFVYERVSNNEIKIVKIISDTEESKLPAIPIILKRK
ncbi:MAG: hypothetical protein IKZ47_02515 [Clostridia bacterium]|nr:hypothetical protein [Clostridia bacterium]